MKPSPVIILVLLIIGSINTACIGNPANNRNKKSNPVHTRNLRVIFEDNFNQTSSIPDTAKWSLCTHYIGDPFISGSYDQAYVKDGKLILKGEKIKGVYKTGGIWTKNKFDFTYGKVEVSAKFISAQGSWPAIWLMPYEPSMYEKAEGEIDIMEQVNRESIVYQTLHSYYITTLKQTSPMRQISARYNVNQFNTYAVEWTPDQIIFSVNGTATLTYPNLHLAHEKQMRQWPYNKPFYLILNIYLGGRWPGEIRDNELPVSMEVDWVKVSQ
jgi:beta-glucanase (GH16 family)